MSKKRKIMTKPLFEPVEAVEQPMVEPVKVKDEVNPTSEVETYEDALRQLVTIYNSRTWQALMVFNRCIDASVFASLASLDPNTEATSMSRIQGQRIGLYILENEIIKEINDREQKEKKANGQPTDEDSVPSYQM